MLGVSAGCSGGGGAEGMMQGQQSMGCSGAAAGGGALPSFPGLSLFALPPPSPPRPVFATGPRASSEAAHPLPQPRPSQGLVPVGLSFSGTAGGHPSPHSLKPGGVGGAQAEACTGG